MNLRNVFISTYTFICNGIRTNNAGPAIRLVNFLKPRLKTIYLLEQPLPGSDFLDTQLTIINNSVAVETMVKNFFFSRTPKKRMDSNKTYIRLKLRDIFSNFYFLFKKYRNLKKEKVDLFIGLESINAIFGIFMRQIGLTDKVVYYVFDWAPDRYANTLMNRIYLWLDKVATYHSDYTWNITYTIGEARKSILHYNLDKMSPQIYVPYCVNFDASKILSVEKVDTNLVIYSGGLIEENGPHLLLEAYKIVMEQHPSSKLMIIGGGGIEQKLREYVAEHNMQKNVEITGYIATEEKIMDLQCKGAIGVAPYPSMKGSRKSYGDVIKVRMYFACGLVVISTPVPPVSREIEDEKLGVRTKDDSPEEIANGICLFLENKELLFKYRKNVIAKAKLSNWEKNYTSVLNKMGFIYKLKEEECKK